MVEEFGKQMIKGKGLRWRHKDREGGGRRRQQRGAHTFSVEAGGVEELGEKAEPSVSAEVAPQGAGESPAGDRALDLGRRGQEQTGKNGGRRREQGAVGSSVCVREKHIL